MYGKTSDVLAKTIIQHQNVQTAIECRLRAASAWRGHPDPAVCVASAESMSLCIVYDVPYFWGGKGSLHVINSLYMLLTTGGMFWNGSQDVSGEFASHGVKVTRMGQGNTSRIASQLPGSINYTMGYTICPSLSLYDARNGNSWLANPTRILNLHNKYFRHNAIDR